MFLSPSPLPPQTPVHMKQTSSHFLSQSARWPLPLITPSASPETRARAPVSAAQRMPPVCFPRDAPWPSRLFWSDGLLSRQCPLLRKMLEGNLSALVRLTSYRVVHATPVTRPGLLENSSTSESVRSKRICSTPTTRLTRMRATF
eukprot:6209857-Pleurochrysis_carterae.AAC.3